VKGITLLAFAALLLTAGCSDDESSCVDCPWNWGGATPKPTLDNVWPNADGTSWQYQHEERQWSWDVTFYPTRDAVPILPLTSWEDVFALVESRTPGVPFGIEQGLYTLTFDGTIITDSGIEAQNLTEQLVIAPPPPPPGNAPPDLDPKTVVTDSSRTVPRGSLSPFSYGGGKASAAGELPIFLHGGPWEKTTEYIGTYGYYPEPRLAWKFLTRDLSVGSQFTYQLNPQFKDDMFLHCLVWRQGSVDTELGVLRNAVDCLYILDWGIIAVTDVQGNLLGYVRLIDYGRVIYAPTVGPVYCYERSAVEPGDPPSGGLGDLTERLKATSATINALHRRM
jgi:hypothetical protein